VADDAVDRRPDGGEAEITLGLGLRGLEVVERVHGLLALRLEHVDIRDRLFERGLRGILARRRLRYVSRLLLGRLPPLGILALAPQVSVRSLSGGPSRR